MTNKNINFSLSILTRVIFDVRRIGLYLYKYKDYSNISINILKGQCQTITGKETSKKIK